MKKSNLDNFQPNSSFWALARKILLYWGPCRGYTFSSIIFFQQLFTLKINVYIKTLILEFNVALVYSSKSVSKQLLIIAALIFYSFFDVFCTRWVFNKPDGCFKTEELYFINEIRGHWEFFSIGNVLVRKNDRTEQLILLRSSSRSLQKRSIQKWNKLPRAVRTIGSRSQFKRILKQHLLQQLKLVPLERNVGGLKSYFYL